MLKFNYYQCVVDDYFDDDDCYCDDDGCDDDYDDFLEFDRCYKRLVA